MFVTRWASVNASTYLNTEPVQDMVCSHLPLPTPNAAVSLSFFLFKKSCQGPSLVAQWLRICLPMQGTRVWALVREDPTCRGATKPVRHSYWACALEPVLCNKRGHLSEKPVHHNEEWPPLTATRKSPRAATKTQRSQKKKKKKPRQNICIIKKMSR